MNRLCTWIATGGACLALGLACSAPPTNARFIATPPSRDQFPAVAQMFVHTCGTLDCHGAIARNFRIWGNTGMRWASTDVPSALTVTTSDEMDATFESLVGLEPEIMSAVVESGGASPDRLTFLRKARGTESHKPGQIITTGDDRDVCITSWLTGTTDQTACANALSYP